MPQQLPENFCETGAVLLFEDQADNEPEMGNKEPLFLPADHDMEDIYGSPTGGPMDGDSDLELLQVQRIVGGHKGKSKTSWHSVLKVYIDWQTEQIIEHSPPLHETPNAGRQERAIWVSLECLGFFGLLTTIQNLPCGMVGQHVPFQPNLNWALPQAQSEPLMKKVQANAQLGDKRTLEEVRGHDDKRIRLRPVVQVCPGPCCTTAYLVPAFDREGL